MASVETGYIIPYFFLMFITYPPSPSSKHDNQFLIAASLLINSISELGVSMLTLPCSPFHVADDGVSSVSSHANI